MTAQPRHERLRVGDVLALARRGGKPGTKAAGGDWYTVRWRVVAFANGSEEVSLANGPQHGPMVVLERLDDNARSQPPGSRAPRPLHSVWWLLNGGGYDLEPTGARP
jgi:hypothetical protein